MADFTDSLIKNIGAHSANPVMTSVNMAELGEKLRQARSSTIASLSNALSSKKQSTAINTSNATTDKAMKSSEEATGRLEVNIVEGRNLTIADALKADTYCIIHYEGNSTSTLERSEDDIVLSNATEQKSAKANAYKAFEIMMRASSPKWMHRVTFDVTSGSKELSVFVYDRGNKLPNGEDRFLGMASITPRLLSNKTVELIFPLKPRPNDTQEVTGDVRLQVTYTNAKKDNLIPEDFRIVRMIGQGSVGKVYEVIKRDSGRRYAMKVLSKRLLAAENEIDNVINERNILAKSLSSPFIANLRYSFQTTNHVFVVMDYFPGGNLFDFFERESCLSEEHCQLFAAELVCAFNDMHSQNIVHRNLKPESVLLDARGHIGLTDFDLAKQLKNADDKLEGVPESITPEYLAPEMVMKKPYGKAVDWWSLGILLFELMTGCPPFHSDDDNELNKQILEQPVAFPGSSCVSEEAMDFVYKLLERDPSKRLGANGVAEVKAHPFFKNINWSIAFKKQLLVPFSPEVEEELADEAIAAATAGMDIAENDEKDTTTAATTTTFTDADQSKFKGFCYVCEENVDANAKKGEHPLGVEPEDEDPEVDFWFRK